VRTNGVCSRYHLTYRTRRHIRYSICPWALRRKISKVDVRPSIFTPKPLTTQHTPPDFDLVRLHHPDSSHIRTRSPPLSPDIAHARFRAIKAAYDFLSGRLGLLTPTLVLIRDQPLISIRISMSSPGGEGLITTLLLRMLMGHSWGF
jgi:hypothetical protein